MGEDKSLLPFGNFDTMIEYQYHKLSQIFSNVYISSKTNKFNFTANLILDDTLEISSPMVALKNIFIQLNLKKVFIITVDTPLIEKQTIIDLINNAKEYDITIAQDTYKLHNLCGVFNISLSSLINEYVGSGMHKINSLVNSVNTNIISFDNEKQFLNINDKNDYKKAILS